MDISISTLVLIVPVFLGFFLGLGLGLGLAIEQFYGLEIITALIALFLLLALADLWHLLKSTGYLRDSSQAEREAAATARFLAKVTPTRALTAVRPMGEEANFEYRF